MNLKMLPLMSMRSQRPGALKAMRNMDLRGVATVATTFNNLSKKKGFRKNFFSWCGNSGNKVKFVYIGHCLIKKSGGLDPLQPM